MLQAHICQLFIYFVLPTLLKDVSQLFEILKIKYTSNDKRQQKTYRRRTTVTYTTEISSFQKKKL